ncbi:DUF443 family protein [Terribacillus saccharophilus]|uniref:DUF443 domain-containing protein n=1 Tax=Terribacillus saccharophilus TaxID=361277 RepID=A0A268AG58_9BACI|nr:DUF443 family protein [Terribacillus saccharophilus]PAD23117.1 hypothetical protein CHH64_00435 [Terribacillus saccharophilus]
MNSEVLLILKNFRYQLIKIENKFYIIDRDKPHLLVFLLPFLYWIFPKRIVQISEDSANHLQTIPNENIKSGRLSLFAVGISMILANLLQPIAEYLSISITPLVASIIVVFFLTILLYFRFLVGKRNKEATFKNLNQGNESNYLKVYIFPRRLKNLISLTALALFNLMLVIVPMLGFISSGNIILLITFIVFFFMLTFFNILIVPHGKNTNKIIIK